MRAESESRELQEACLSKINLILLFSFIFIRLTGFYRIIRLITIYKKEDVINILIPGEKFNKKISEFKAIKFNILL